MNEELPELLAAPTRFIVGLPDTEIIERPGWRQIITPSLVNGGLNDVSLAVLAPHEADAAIERVLATYASHGVAFRWFVGPDSSPADLGDRLAARGLVPTEVRVMARDLGSDEGGTALESPSVELVEGDGPALAAFTDVMARGWGSDPEVIHRMHQAMLAHPAGRHRLFLSRAAGVPAGAAAYVAASERTAYLMGAVVLPELRGQGHYRALVAARLRDARARGITIATSQANAATSAPILSRLGFTTVARIACYRG